MCGFGFPVSVLLSPVGIPEFGFGRRLALVDTPSVFMSPVTFEKSVRFGFGKFGHVHGSLMRPSHQTGRGIQCHTTSCRFLPIRKHPMLALSCLSASPMTGLQQSPVGIHQLASVWTFQIFQNAEDKNAEPAEDQEAEGEEAEVSGRRQSRSRRLDRGSGARRG